MPRYTVATPSTRRWRSEPQPLLFLALQLLVGLGMAAVVLVALLLGDPGGLASVLLQAESHPWPLLLLWFFTGMTFGGVQFGVAVMLAEA